MKRFALRPAPIVVFGALLAACATKPASPTQFYVSRGGDHPPTNLVADAVDTRMRTQPGFVRAFDQPMQVHINDGSALPGGRYRFAVTVKVDRTISGRRLSAKDAVLAQFYVTCVPQSPSPCVEIIVARARQQPARLARILARSPRA
ncbi:MAG: hypothetical protein ABW063_12205 [Caulobacter sp.]